VQVNITNLIDDVQCYQTVRELRWPAGVACPSCESQQVIKRGFDDTEPARQRYECIDCHTRFDDLTDTIFAGHHQPLKVWVLCLYFSASSPPILEKGEPFPRVICIHALSCSHYKLYL
jgi:transposase-like protein